MLNNGQFLSALVSCEWLLENSNLEHLIILDAREKNQNSITSECYISNSRHFNLKDDFSDTTGKFPNTFPTQQQFELEARELGVNNNSIIVVYDDKGIYWSPRVWWLFKCYGFENIAVLDGGLPEWQRLNYKTESILASKSWEKGDFNANYQPERMRFFNEINKISKDQNCALLDARSEDRFKGQVPEPRVGLRSGTIPNSKNLPYTNLFNGHRLKPKSEIKAIFEAYKIGDKSVTFTCGSGITACILALAAEIADYKQLSVYDGSWTEYGTLTL